MAQQRSVRLSAHPVEATPPQLGTYGHLAVFGWLLALVMLQPGGQILISGGLCLVVAVLLYPNALRDTLRLRWLALLLLLALPPVFFLDAYDASLAGIPYSTEGLLAGGQIAVRFVVVLVAVQGFTGAVDIPTLAGLLERLGLHGLGFSIGVALNLLPSLQQSSRDAWYTLRMRGGLRRQRWRGLQLLVITIVTNALRRAEDIALAAEARAFAPERAQALPIRRGKLDWVPFVFGPASLILLALV